MKKDKRVIIVGAGAAGLMAAEQLCQAGHQVDVYDAMPSAGRKILMAGKSGLNISHAEPFDRFLSRYGDAAPWLEPALQSFGAQDVQAWAQGLGVETFVGSSGRIFPKEMKAAPLLRAWMRRLKASGMHLHARHRWTGFDARGGLLFETGNGTLMETADAVLLATGGSSWPALGSDGAWMPWLQERGLNCYQFRPANCGFDCDWTEVFAERFAGEPVKSILLTVDDITVSGDFVITNSGIEGSAVYGVSAPLRDQIDRHGQAVLSVDLSPNRTMNRLVQDLSKPRGKKSFSTWFRARTGLTPAKAALVREIIPDVASAKDPSVLAGYVKNLPVPVLRPRPIEEAISVAGGVDRTEVNAGLMIRKIPGLFLAGEMLDWEAPTGGYLLTACFAQGRWAGQAINHYLESTA